MKVFGISLFLSIAAFLQCAGGVSDAPNGGGVNSVPDNARPAATVSNDKNMNQEVFSAQGKKDEIEYRIVGRLQKKGAYEGVNYPQDNFVVEYELKNTGAKNFILFNQGHAHHTNAVLYAEPLADGTVELSQKAFTEPADKNCPARYVPIVPRGAWLKAGQSVREKVYFELPWRAKYPFDDCAEKPEISANAAKIKFCLGYLEAAGQDLKIDEAGNLNPLPDLKNQRFLCTSIGEMK